MCRFFVDDKRKDEFVSGFMSVLTEMTSESSTGNELFIYLHNPRFATGFTLYLLKRREKVNEICMSISVTMLTRNALH